jgi:hypothetical protein
MYICALAFANKKQMLLKPSTQLQKQNLCQLLLAMHIFPSVAQTNPLFSFSFIGILAPQLTMVVSLAAY